MNGVVSLGSIFGLLLQYWWATGIVLLAVIGAGAYLFLNRRRARKAQEIKKEVNAVIFDGNVRSKIVAIPQAEIKDFTTLRPRIVNGKKVYYLRPVMKPATVIKPSGNGEHEDKESVTKQVPAKTKVTA